MNEKISKKHWLAIDIWATVSTELQKRKVKLTIGDAYAGYRTVLDICLNPPKHNIKNK